MRASSPALHLPCLNGRCYTDHYCAGAWSETFKEICRTDLARLLVVLWLLLLVAIVSLDVMASNRSEIGVFRAPVATSTPGVPVAYDRVRIEDEDHVYYMP